MEILSTCEAQTREIAKKYAETLNRGDVVVLSGELGAGKTAFVKGVADYFGLSGVTSATGLQIIIEQDEARLDCSYRQIKLALKNIGRQVFVHLGPVEDIFTIIL